ncbi:MAG: SRPBCC family protein [Pseudomonadota bacterium]
MKLKVSDDAECPVDLVYAGITDFARIESELRDHGVHINRIGKWDRPEIGAAWAGRGEIRSKMRRIDAKITAMEPGRMFEVEAKIGGLRVAHETRLVPLGERVTRINITTDLRPDTLSARLLLQSLKLARGRVLDRMQRRLASDIRRIERAEAG